MKLTIKFLHYCAIIGIAIALICCVKATKKPAHEIVPVHFQSATELANSIRQGEITSTELLNLYLNRIQKYNNDINAIVALDAESARARAKEADKAVTQGQNWGPLHGLPMIPFQDYVMLVLISTRNHVPM